MLPILASLDVLVSVSKSSNYYGLQSPFSGVPVNYDHANTSKQPVVAKRRLDFEPGGGMPTSVTVRGLPSGMTTVSAAFVFTAHGVPYSHWRVSFVLDHQTLRINSIQLPGSGTSNTTASSANSRGETSSAANRKLMGNSLALFFRKVRLFYRIGWCNLEYRGG